MATAADKNNTDVFRIPSGRKKAKATSLRINSSACRFSMEDFSFSCLRLVEWG